MKKIMVCLVLIAFLFIPGCGKSEAAKTTESLIEQIGEVTKNSQSAIDNAERSYEGLSEKEQKSIQNYDELTQAQETLNQILASEVESIIGEIGPVTENSTEAIQNAQAAYDNLTDEQKNLVNNADLLKEAKKEYDSLRVKHVESLIDAIGEVNQSSECEQLIIAAETAYQDLDNILKPDVSNYSKLIDARELFDNPPPLKINGYKLGKNIIGQPTIKFDITNVSEKVVKEYCVALFIYDSEGLPVKIYFNDFYQMLNDTDPLKAGSRTKSNSYWQLYGTYSEMKQVVAYIDEVEFYDGTTWTNPKSGQLFSRYYETMLPAGDENVIR